MHSSLRPRLNDPGFLQIIQERGISAADREIAPVTEVFCLQRMDEIERLEKKFVR